MNLSEILAILRLILDCIKIGYSIGKDIRNKKQK